MKCTEIEKHSDENLKQSVQIALCQIDCSLICETLSREIEVDYAAGKNKNIKHFK